MTDLNFFEKNLQELSDLQQKLIGERSALLRKHSQKIQEVEKLKLETLEIQKAKLVLEDLIKQFIGFQLDKIKEYVSYGLKTVIPDQNIEFDCNVTTKMNKPWVELLTKNSEGVSENALEAFGGSVAQVESLILRVLAILQLKLYPMIVLDESLNAVSEEYLPNLSVLLNELSKQLNIKILLVTHNKEILANATRVYRATETSRGLKFTEVHSSEVVAT